MARIADETRTIVLAGPGVVRDEDDDVPEWSAETEEALSGLSVIERSFVEWLAAGCSKAEAYRRASGLEYANRDKDTTRTRGWRMMSRPRVQHALRLAMKDMNFDARMDRAWMLNNLEVALEKAKTESSGESMARIIDIIAKLKGEHLPPAPQKVEVTHDATPAMKRFLETIEKARKAAGNIE